MNTQDAIELLGIVPEDDEREIKRKYHKMISRFHPTSIQRVGYADSKRFRTVFHKRLTFYTGKRSSGIAPDFLKSVL